MTLTGVFASEWLKLRSVRSTYWTLGVAAVTMPLIAFLIANSTAADPGEHFDPTDAMVGGAFVQLAFGVLGVLVITSEYSTGLIRTTLAAVPKRRTLLAVKGAMLFGLLLIVGELIALATFLVAQATFPAGLGISITDPGALSAVLGSGFYMAFVGMFGFGLGALIRHTPGAITTMMAVVFVIMSILPQLFPESIRDDVGRYSFLGLAHGLSTISTGSEVPLDSTSVALCFTYAALVLLPAFFLIGRRDA
jgi:ABC-2 type transport system permease protein